ncbi:MAG: Holliday junction resolvase RuvX [Erysipelotrichales bacterium]|nr:Holliday junction resolvase RuvX [Erysipelotrichales bacterium]
MEKILGLDLGSRTCGIAMSDALGMIAHGVETYHFKENHYKSAAYHIKGIVEENNIHRIVLGLPKHMNGDLGERAQISIDFKERLEKMMDVEVILIDERLTTVMAQNQLIFADVSRKKRKQVIDKMAAVQILQGYLDGQRR